MNGWRFDKKTTGNGARRQVRRRLRLKVMKRTLALIVLSAAALGLSGCITHETRPQTRVKAVQAATEIPQAQLLDVGVRLFEENLPKDEKVMEEKHIFP